MTNENAQPVRFLSILAIGRVLYGHRYLLIGAPIVACAFAFLASLFLSDRYLSTARVMPPQIGQSATAAALGQLGAFSSIIGNSLGVRNPSDLYVGMLKSRTIADRIIEKFRLQETYKTKTFDDTRRALERNTNIWAGREGIVSVAFE